MESEENPLDSEDRVGGDPESSKALPLGKSIGCIGIVNLRLRFHERVAACLSSTPVLPIAAV